MEDHFLSLTCPQCGAKLDVYDDTDWFTCSYCESDVEVNLALEAQLGAARQSLSGSS